VDIHRCPAHFFITFADNPPEAPAWLRQWQAAAGRGFDRDRARISAICEAVERASLIGEGHDDPRVAVAPPAAERTLEALHWLNYSAEQLHNTDANLKYTAISGCANGVDNLWIKGRDLASGSVVAVSATAALFGEDARLGLPQVFSSSTGAALRDTIDGATRHALLELVERDAVAIWWYNSLNVPRVEQRALRAALPPDFARWLDERRRITWHLAMPTDLPASVIVALSARPDGSNPAIGAAAAIEPADAVRAATLELLQCEIALAQMRAAQNAPDPPQPPPLLAWSTRTNAFDMPYLAGIEETVPLPPPSDHQALVQHLGKHGIEVVVVDLTRPEIGVPVVKAISPHLRDWLPRFGPGRLYDVPVALGLRETPTREADLNPVAFVI